MPPELFDLNLAYLYLDGNNISFVPADIGKFKNMVGMRLDHNAHLKRLPDEMGELVKLETLDLRHNAIETLPSTFKNLQRLKYLYLDGNDICMSDEWKSNKPPNVIDEMSGCRAQCNEYCQDRYTGNGLDEGKCWNECNSESCITCESCNTCECGCNRAEP